VHLDLLRETLVLVLLLDGQRGRNADDEADEDGQEELVEVVQ